MNLDRVPPHSQEAEMGICGCVLTDPRCLSEVVERIGADGRAFHVPSCRTLFERFLVMQERGIQIDLVTVVSELKTAGELQALGGIEFLTKAQDSALSTSNLSAYLDLLEETFQLRRLSAVCTAIVYKIHEGGDQSGTIDEAERDVLAVRALKRNGVVGIKELTQQALDQIERFHGQQGAISGLSTGLEDLNKMTDGLHPEEMTVIAAYPGNGKTSLALNIVERVAVDDGLAVGLFSLEMSSKQLALRMLSSRARINIRNVKDGKMSQDDFSSLAVAAGRISSSLLFLDDVSALSIAQIRASARRMAQSHAVRLIVIDYIQLIGSQSVRPQNREQDVSDISKGIKGMAMELKIPVLALSQLNDDGKLRESRAIGQDADNVWVIDPDENNPGNDEDEGRGMILKIKKQRNGPTGNVLLTFLKTCTRFVGRSHVDRTDYPKNVKRQHNDA